LIYLAEGAMDPAAALDEGLDVINAELAPDTAD